MPEVGATDFLSFTVCPIVHSIDDTAPMVGLQSLPPLLATARARYPGRALRIGPSGLGARGSPLGHQPASDGTRRVALAQRDPRTRGLFGAAWLLGHVAHAARARAGAEAVSVMSLLGDAGVMDEATDGRLVKHPTFFVLAQLARMKHPQTVSVSIRAHVVALASGCNKRTEWLLANLTSGVVEMSLGDAMVASVMDTEAWLAYAAGQADSPWRAPVIGQARVMRLEPFGIALLA